MPTPVSEIREILSREINVPGFPQLPGITNTQLDGYVLDGFWEARLLGMLEGYTATDGTELATPVGSLIKAIVDDGDLPQQFKVLVAIVAGLKMIRLKALNLAVSFSAKAGPVEYEQQASATVLRAVLDSLERRLKELKEAHSDLFSTGAFIYFDGEFQREAAMLAGLREISVLP